MYMPPQSLTDDILPNHYEKARMVGGEYLSIFRLYILYIYYEEARKLTTFFVIKMQIFY